MKPLPQHKIALPMHTRGRFLYPAILKSNNTMDRRYAANKHTGKARDARVRMAPVQSGS